MSRLPRDSATATEALGEKVRWGDAEHLLAVLVDLMQTDVWMQSKDAQHNRNRPKPIRRPGQEPEGRRLGRGRYTPQELTEIFGW